MSYLKSSMNILLVVTVCIFIVSCAEDPPTPGCCQLKADACASPVNEQQCTDLNGQSFHEGGTCRTMTESFICSGSVNLSVLSA